MNALETPACPRCDGPIVLWAGEFTCSACGLTTIAAIEAERLVAVKEWKS